LGVDLLLLAPLAACSWEAPYQRKLPLPPLGTCFLAPCLCPQVALVVICTVIGAALLLGLGEASTMPLAAFVAVFEQQASAAAAGGGASSAAALQPAVDDMLSFAAREVPDLVRGLGRCCALQKVLCAAQSVVCQT
jgi:hypothetical protein